MMTSVPPAPGAAEDASVDRGKGNRLIANPPSHGLVLWRLGFWSVCLRHWKWRALLVVMRMSFSRQLLRVVLGTSAESKIANQCKIERT